MSFSLEGKSVQASSAGGPRRRAELHLGKPESHSSQRHSRGGHFTDEWGVFFPPLLRRACTCQNQDYITQIKRFSSQEEETHPRAYRGGEKMVQMRDNSACPHFLNTQRTGHSYMQYLTSSSQQRCQVDIGCFHLNLLTKRNVRSHRYYQ